VEFAGDYENPGYGKMDVYTKNDSLFAQMKTRKIWLRHHHYDIFAPYQFADGKPDTTQAIPLFFNFRTNDQGEIASLIVKFEPATDPIEFKRTPKAMAMEKADLEKLAGEYELAGMVAKFYLKGENPILYLTVPGQPEYELVGVEKNKFLIKNLEGFKVEFVVNEAGTPQEAMFIQPNGAFKAKKK
jgi:hypothetical protein